MSAKAPLHIAVIGDSLTTGFFVSSRLAMAWRARRHRRRGWFVDDMSAVHALAARLSAHGPVVPHHFATVGAAVDDDSPRTFADRILGTRHYSDQITSIERLCRFPDIVVVWIGHNNVDAVGKFGDGASTDDGLQDIADRFATAFRRHTERLLRAAAQAEGPVAIVVFGLIDFRSFFAGREQAERVHREQPHRYRRLVEDYRYFESLRPQHRASVIDLAVRMNRGLERCVEALCADGTVVPHVTLTYSEALCRTDISTDLALSDVDAWHPSVFGHQLLAESAYAAVAERLAQMRDSIRNRGM